MLLTGWLPGFLLRRISFWGGHQWAVLHQHSSGAFRLDGQERCALQTALRVQLGKARLPAPQ